MIPVLVALALSTAPAVAAASRSPLQHAVWCATALQHGLDTGLYDPGRSRLAAEPARAAVADYEADIPDLAAEAGLDGAAGTVTLNAMRYKVIAELESGAMSPAQIELELTACALGPPLFDFLVGE